MPTIPYPSSPTQKKAEIVQITLCTMKQHGREKPHSENLAITIDH